MKEIAPPTPTVMLVSRRKIGFPVSEVSCITNVQTVPRKGPHSRMGALSLRGVRRVRISRWHSIPLFVHQRKRGKKINGMQWHGNPWNSIANVMLNQIRYVNPLTGCILSVDQMQRVQIVVFPKETVASDRIWLLAVGPLVLWCLCSFSQR